MATRTAHDPTRVLSMWAASFVLAVMMLGNVLLTGAKVSAQCSLSPDETVFVALLAQKNIGPVPGSTFCDLAFAGHVVAYDVRNGVSPDAEAAQVYMQTDLSMDQATWFVAAAVVVFAPEMVPPDVRNGAVA